MRRLYICVQKKCIMYGLPKGAFYSLEANKYKMYTIVVC